jgi:hypothetical protein
MHGRIGLSHESGVVLGSIKGESMHEPMVVKE